MSKTIKVDIDSVIRDIHTEMLRVYNSSAFCEKKLSYEDLIDFDVRKVYPGLLDPKDFFFRVYSKEVFEQAKPCEKAIEGLLMLKDAGHKIILVSCQYKHNMASTIKWCIDNQVPFDDICFCSDKSVVKGDFILDDKLENLYSCISVGECAVCLSRPWNSKWKGLQVSNIVEFAELLEKINLQNIK